MSRQKSPYLSSLSWTVGQLDSIPDPCGIYIGWAGFTSSLKSRYATQDLAEDEFEPEDGRQTVLEPESEVGIPEPESITRMPEPQIVECTDSFDRHILKSLA